MAKNHYVQKVKIEPSAHGVPGLGALEYFYNKSNKTLLLNVEPAIYLGDDAVNLFELLSNDEMAEPMALAVDLSARKTLGFPLFLVKTNTRMEEIKEARQVIQHWLTVYTILTQNEIAEITGQGERSTIPHSVKVINNFLDSGDVRITAKVNAFRNWMVVNMSGAARLKLKKQ